jgi:hypothetical protein
MIGVVIHLLIKRLAQFMRWLDNIPLSVLIVATLLLGLAPFVPEPHVWQKLNMLFSGTLSKPADIFDLFLHGTPWLLLIAKLLRTGIGKPDTHD